MKLLLVLCFYLGLACSQDVGILRKARNHELAPHVAKSVLRTRHRRQSSVDDMIQAELAQDMELLYEDGRYIPPNWEAPEINAISCRDPGIPANGYRTGNKFGYGAIVTFSCYQGYVLEGDYVRACLFSDGWSGRQPICRQLGCGDPGTPANGQRTGNQFTYGKSLVFSCNVGYRLEGDHVRTCGSNEQWSGTQPVCRQVLCPAPTAPANGAVTAAAGVGYGQRAQYTCTAGYVLEGLNYQVCQENGQWSGTRPTCNLIKCGRLNAPASGSVQHSSLVGGQVPYGATATYSCNSGYRLNGNTVRTCAGTNSRGVWTGTQPTCRGVDCENPGNLENGVKTGSNHIFPSGAVSYQCNPGFYLRGQSSLTCLASGQWSAAKPTCVACPRDYYKRGTNALTQCTACPAHSGTAATGMVAREQCTCKEGYTGPNGGSCQLITCQDLPIPANGVKGACGTTYGAQCQISCREGYIRIAGNAVRQCVGTGQWTGSPAQCQACEVNTYKASDTLCSRCPEDSYTNGAGHGRAGCICGTGFHGPAGGPCNDINECARENGGCEQSCENSIGSYRCMCTSPGFIPDAADATKCAPKNQCPALEAPGNSGMVCVMQRNVNTQRCEMKCNPGYEHTVRPDGYEQCGPSTNWIWSNELNDIPLLPCQESFFPGIQLEAEYFYWVEHCEYLTPDQKSTAINEFLDFLRAAGVCSSEGLLACSIEDATIYCESNRRKRSAGFRMDMTSAIFRVNIEVGSVSAKNVNCRAICDWPEASDRYCNRTCQQNYHNMMERLLKEEIRQGAAGSSGIPSSRVHASVAESQFFPGINLEQPQPPEFIPQLVPPTMTSMSMCGTGMVSRGDHCAECPTGTYTHPNGIECALCQPGTYQPNKGSSGCLPCSQQREHGGVSCP